MALHPVTGRFRYTFVVPAGVGAFLAFTAPTGSLATGQAVRVATVMGS